MWGRVEGQQCCRCTAAGLPCFAAARGAPDCPTHLLHKVSVVLPSRPTTRPTPPPRRDYTSKVDTLMHERREAQVGGPAWAAGQRGRLLGRCLVFQLCVAARELVRRSRGRACITRPAALHGPAERVPAVLRCRRRGRARRRRPRSRSRRPTRTCTSTRTWRCRRPPRTAGSPATAARPPTACRRSSERMGDVPAPPSCPRP